MEHVGKQKGRWRFTLKPIAERADFSNKTVGLNQIYVHAYIYNIYIYNPIWVKIINPRQLDILTTWQRLRNHGYPSWPRSRPHRPVQQRWSTNERNKRDALQQAINIMGHRFPQLSTFTAERFYGVFIWSYIIPMNTPYYPHISHTKIPWIPLAFLRHIFRSTPLFPSLFGSTFASGTVWRMDGKKSPWKYEAFRAVTCPFTIWFWLT